MTWKKLDITDFKLEGGEYSTRIYTSNRSYLKITNKLVKRKDGWAYLLYQDGFTFDLFSIEYGRFGKRHDEWDRKVDSNELETIFEPYTNDVLPLPEVTGKPLEDLLDD